MYWLYFARDFYRTPAGMHSGMGAQATQRQTPPPQIVTVVLREPPENNPAPVATKRSAAKRQVDYVVRSEPDFGRTAAAQPSAATPPLNSYLQRLSVDGEHAFAVWDEEAGFSMFSANFERVTGLSSGECAGHEWIHMIHHTQQYAVNEAMLAALEGADGRCLVQAKRMKEDAEERWLMLDIKAPSESQPCIMVLMRDLTETKALEEALAQTESALAMSEGSRAAFLSSMSHELRTPLNAIMGFSEMMKSGVFGELGNPTYVEYAKHIHDSGSTLLGKINDLLDIASMDANGLEIQEEDFRLEGMLAEAIEIHNHTAFARQQTLKLDCKLKLEIMGDRAKLMCAASHLITNALRHSAEGAEVTVSVRVQYDEGIIISVRDAGEGIPTGQLEIIRTALNSDIAYFKIESGGIGLGLSLTKELVQRHGGRVMIDSVRHRGTVVSMILPTARVMSGMPQKRKRMQ
ncbi:MAG: ATP-binding protein [Rickettsiales bacterium]